jgi:succinate-acetate transporter protein
MGCWLIGGFVIQFVVALVDLKGQNGTGGNTFLFFSAFFMLTGGLELFLKYHAIAAGSHLDGRIDGYAWTVLTAILFLWTPAFFAKFSLLSVVVVLIDISLPFITLIDYGILPKATYGHIPAWSLLFAGIVAIYLASATVVNQAFGRVVYPLPGQPRSVKKETVSSR